MKTVWYHQIWLQTYLGFIVSYLLNIHFSNPPKIERIKKNMTVKERPYELLLQQQDKTTFEEIELLK